MKNEFHQNPFFLTVANAMIATTTERLVPEMSDLPGKRRTFLSAAEQIL